MPGNSPAPLTVSVIIPVYNEVTNIGRVIAEIRALPPDPAYTLEILVVDGGSKDGTVEAARSAGARVLPQKERGYGAACYTGFEATTAEIVVFLDGDYSDPPAALPALLAPLMDERADLVLGTRMGPRPQGGPGRDALPAQAVWGNRLVTGLIRLLYGYKLSDLPSFKAIRREQLASFGMQEMTYGWTTEMLVKAVRSKYRIVEVPVAYRPRGGGQSKVSGTVKGTLKAAYFLLMTTFRYTRWQPPN
jgi:glycosyltransferase involved in cell wall biosynthesis